MVDDGERPLAPPPSGPAAPQADPALTGPSLPRATAVMSIGTALSRVTGFARIAVMAWAIGGTESKLPDTYNLANSLPNMVYQLVIGEVLATVFVPVFVEQIKTRSREDSRSLASSILSVAVLVAGAFSALTVLLAPWIIKIYTFGVDDPALRAQQEAVGTFFLRIFMPQMIFYAAGAALTGLLNAHRRFAAPMFAPVLNNVIVSATFVAFRVKNGGGVPDLLSLTAGDKWLLAGGTTAGVIAMTVVLWPFVTRLRAGYRLGRPTLRHPAVRHVGNLARYSLGYVVVNQIGLWIVLALANGGRDGGVTAYQSSFILYQLPYGIFAVSIMTFLVPRLAEHHVDGDVAAVRADVSLGLRTTAFVIVPAAAGFIALSEPILRLLLEHGVFGAASTELFARTFVLMALGLASYASFQQVMRAFYAMQDTRTPWLVNIIAIGAQIAAAFPLFAWLGVPGLGLSHAISYTVGAVVGVAILRRRLGGIDGARLLRSFARIGVGAAGTGLAAWLVARALGEALSLGTFIGQLTQVGTAVAAGLVLYVVVARLLRFEEFQSLAKILARRLRGSRA